MSADANGSDTKKSPIQEIVQPFVDLIHAPRALWGINLAYVIEGMVYFGMLGYLAIHFSDYIFQGVDRADVYSHSMVMVLTSGITIAMFFLGFVADKAGVRFALIFAFTLMLAGRVLWSGAPTIFGLEPAGLWSSLHWVTLAGMLLVVIGYGMYQPAAYAGVRQFTTPKTAAMGFAMLYALMNLGGWLPTFAFLLRDDTPFHVKFWFVDFSIPCLGLGIPGTYWVYTGFTVVALISTILILTRRTVRNAIETAKEETARIKAQEAEEGKTDDKAKIPEGGASEVVTRLRVAPHMWLFWIGAMALFLFKPESPWYYTTAELREGWASAGFGAGVVIRWLLAAIVFVLPVAFATVPPLYRWLARHPLSDGKFAFFIFALIPVQTLFTYNWLILPQYINRAFEGWIGDKFEIFANANPILIFIAVPIITAMTQKAKVYNMMIYGTFIMAAPAFLLVIGPYWWTLLVYILIMTIGEAMWQPRFLQYAAEIAPEGRTGQYMGVAQLPWFLTKVLVPLLYSGWMMDRYCPADGDQNTQFMWLIFGCIAITSTMLLVLAKPWIGKDFKTKAD